jgi:hypothetical protein
MILDQFNPSTRKYGPTNALIFNGERFYREMLRRAYKRARQSGCGKYEARQLLWDSLWYQYLANGANDKTAVTFVSHLTRPRKVDA